MSINRAVRCDHNLIYEGITDVECDEPGCKNFDPAMYEFRVCANNKDVEGVCFVWGVLWDVLYNIVHTDNRFVLHQSTLYEPGSRVWLRPIDIEKMEEIVIKQRDEGILDFSDAFSSSRWSAKDQRKIKSYFVRAIELGRERYNRGKD